jgi:molybdopterin synthase sulfur carrier subunit
MRVVVKLHATLRDGRFEMAERDLPLGATVADALADLAIDRTQATLLFLNSRHAGLDDELHDGDVLALFPPIGGG